jgi:hypothetical protein
MGDTLASDLKIARLLQRLNGARRTSSLGPQPDDSRAADFDAGGTQHRDDDGSNSLPADG